MAQLHSSTIQLVRKYLFWSVLELNVFLLHLMALSFCIRKCWAVLPYMLLTIL